MDFSEAQKQGFIDAFIQTRLDLGDKRTREELRRAGEDLIKGCGEHYRAAVTRVCHISAVVPPERRQEFKEAAYSLTRPQSLSEFLDMVRWLLNEFPLCRSWLEWWLRHGRMIFPALMTIDPEDFAALPFTTNAQESMHHKLYAQADKNHDFWPGARSLYRFAAMYEEEVRDKKRKRVVCLTLDFKCLHFILRWSSNQIR